MSIHEIAEKIKTKHLNILKGDKGKQIALILIVLLTSTLSFGLGRLSILENSNKVSIIMPNGQVLENTTNNALNGQNTAYNALQNDLKSHEFINQASSESKLQNDSGGTPTSTVPDGALFTASKRGKKYYPIYCKAAESLSPSNKIYFLTEDEATAKGYTKSSNCK